MLNIYVKGHVILKLLFNKKTNIQTNKQTADQLHYTAATTVSNKYVSPLHCRAEMYAGRVACCPLVSHGEYANGTDRQMARWTKAIPLHYAFL